MKRISSLKDDFAPLLSDEVALRNRRLAGAKKLGQRAVKRSTKTMATRSERNAEDDGMIGTRNARR